MAANCKNCGKAVDMQEVPDGGSPDGCQLRTGEWVCSFECWEQEEGMPDGE